MENIRIKKIDYILSKVAIGFTLVFFLSIIILLVIGGWRRIFHLDDKAYYLYNSVNNCCFAITSNDKDFLFQHFSKQNTSCEFFHLNDSVFDIVEQPIKVKILDYYYDSTIVKVQRLKMINPERFFTLRCFIKDKSPEDFQF